MLPKSDCGIWQEMVEYSHAVMNEVRRQAVDGFNSFAHGGLEIGGVLYGEKRDTVVRVLASAQLPCEHARGPGFALSERDEEAFRELMKAPPGMRVVGWYCSHTRTGLALNPNDCAIFERFFGERGNVALIVKPTHFGPVEATFHVQGCAEPGPHFSVLAARETAAATDDNPPPPGAVAESATATKPAAEPIVAPPAPTISAAPPATSNVREGIWPAHRFPLRWIALAIIFAAAGAAYISIRPAGKKVGGASPRVGLQAYSIADRQVRIEWDRQSAAVRGAKSGVLEIADGTDKYAVPLSAEQLRTSSLTYGRQSNAISVRLRLASGVEESVQVLAAQPSPVAVASAEEPVSAPPKQDVPDPGAERATLEAREPQAERRIQLKPFVLTAEVAPKVREVFLPEPPPPVRTAVGTAALPLGILPKLPVATPAPPHVPRSGRMIWTGSLGRRGVVEFEGSSPTIGSLSGGLPGVAAKLSVLPAEFANDGLTVYVTDAARHNRTEAPGPATGWNRLHFVWDPERVKQISVLESPNPSNQFGRLALRNNARSLSVIVVEWSVP